MSGCERGCMEVVRRIMEVYVDAYEWLNEHDLAFWKHCEGVDVGVLRLLVREGLDVNVVGLYGITIFHIACGKGYTEIVQFLVECGADVNSYDEWRRTPLHEACWKGHTEIVQLLIDHGANLNIGDVYGQTSLLIVFKNNKLNLIPILRQAYIQQNILTLPQLTSFPNTNSFSSVKIESKRFLGHVLYHSLSRRQMRGYMDKRGLVRNGMRELAVRFPRDLNLIRDEGRACGYRMEVRRWNINNTFYETLLLWESEGAYELI